MELHQTFVMLETLVIGAIGGFLSGISVYVVRQKRRADKLRLAIATEIQGSTPVGTFEASLLGTDSLKTPIIDSNLDKLYLLNKREIELVANYQQHMAQVRDYNQRESDENMISISNDLQRKGEEIATNTADALEGNITTLSKLGQWLESRYRQG